LAYLLKNDRHCEQPSLRLTQQRICVEYQFRHAGPGQHVKQNPQPDNPTPAQSYLSKNALDVVQYIEKCSKIFKKLLLSRSKVHRMIDSKQIFMIKNPKTPGIRTRS
jgi:hypothetical protein